MSLKWNVTKNELSLKTECHSKGNDTENGLSIKKKCHSKFKITECHSKWIVIQNGKRNMTEMKCHSNWNVTQKVCHLK
jgi:hypothetical protein